MERPAHPSVAILGGGLAGLTLALQLRLRSQEIQVIILEKREEDAPVATHKIGESVVELGSSYLQEIGLGAYLHKHHVLKRGFRFFFSPEEKEDFSHRLEMGASATNPFPTFQIDRGLFENDLSRLVEKHDVRMLRGATVRDITIGKINHLIEYEQNGQVKSLEARWVIDATGRRSLLRRQLSLDLPISHTIHACWFRVPTDLDIDHWSEQEDWKERYSPGHRRLATNHLMGKGYWIWVIPLSTGYTSIGLVMDPDFHDPRHLRNVETLYDWLESQEPATYARLLPWKREIDDFRSFKQLAHDSSQFYSTDRWGVTGDAGAFLDPFYSPGTDFIGLSNSWLTDLVIRDCAGESIALRSKIFNHVHRELLDNWISLYQGMYRVFGSTQIMLYKTIWDWSCYWAIPCLLFMNEGYTDLSIIKGYADKKSGLGRKFSTLNSKVQQLFLAWERKGVSDCSREVLNYFSIRFLRAFHDQLKNPLPREELLPRIKRNITILEKIAAELFRLVNWSCHEGSLEATVDPYHIDLDEPERATMTEGGLPVDFSIRADMQMAWFISERSPERLYE